MTPYQTIYDAFLSKILEDEWQGWTTGERNEDLRMILESALPNFKFPRISLERDSNGFVNTLDTEEIQIISSYMRCEWLNRTILSWENVKPLYTEKDFSQANLLDKFKQLLVQERELAQKLEANYYRAIKHKPFSYSQLAKN